MRWSDKVYKNGQSRCALMSDDCNELIVVYHNPKNKTAPFTFSCYAFNSVTCDAEMEATNIQDAKTEAINWFITKCKVQISWMKNQVQEYSKRIEEIQSLVDGG